MVVSHEVFCYLWLLQACFTSKDFFKENIGKIVTQVDAMIPEEKRKEFIKEKIGPMVMQLSPKYGEAIIGILMSFDLSKLVPLTDDPKKLEETVRDEEKKLITKEEKCKDSSAKKL